MKSVVIIQFCVLLLTIVSNGAAEDPLVAELRRIARNNGSINDVFEPVKGGYLGEHALCFIYQGRFIPANTQVAMKVIDEGYDGKHEYAMYTYMSAIHHEDSEAFGIPSVYYYGTWENRVIMAITLLDRVFYDKKRSVEVNRMDLLIYFRDFVRITKKMHSSGVFHENINFQELGFRKHQAFIYDFNYAVILPNAVRERRLRYARNNWKGFLFSIYKFILSKGKRWEWIGFSRSNEHDVQLMKSVGYVAESFKYEDESNEPHNCSELRKVFREFAKFAYGDDDAPPSHQFYDQLYALIVDEMEKYAQRKRKLPIPSWITNNADRNAAVVAKDTIPEISFIRNPFELDAINYERVRYRYFDKVYHGRQSSSSEDDGQSSWDGVD